MLFALSVTGAVATVKLGDDWMEWHVRFGIISLALLLFRLIWGIVGSHYSRFSQFVRSPAATLSYLKSVKVPNQKTAGHNPLGAWSVLAMLVIIGVQATTGLFTRDEIMTQGPLVEFVSESTSDLLTKSHHLNETLLYIFIVYTLRGHGLVKPMITGNVPTNRLPLETTEARDTLTLRLWALGIAVVLACAAYYLIQLS